MAEFKVISSDSHIIEPPDLWTTRIEAKYRDRAPYVRLGEDADNWYIEGNVDLGSLGTTVGAGQRFIDPSKMTTKAKLEEIPRGAYDPDEHVRDMHLDGVDAGVIYPSVGLRVFRVPDSGLLTAIFRTYNDWLSEFCGAYPDLLKGIAMVNVDDVQEGIEELKRARKLGLAGAMISVFPQEGRSYKHPNYEPLWATAQDLDIPLSLHTGTSRPPGGVGVGGFTLPTPATLGPPENRANTEFPVRLSLAALVFWGVFERYPNLNVLSVEHELAWVPYFIRELDYVYRERPEQAVYRFKGDAIPSDFMRRNVWYSFQEDDLGIQLRHHIGVDRLMWGSDYPHAESTFPRSREVINEIMEGVPGDERDQIVGRNAAQLYHFG